MKMQRIRTVKPSFFLHEGLFDLEQETQLPIRLSYAGLWTCCDREGRFDWRPRQLKAQILPYDTCDFSHVLDALRSRGFIVRYEVNGEYFGHVPTWTKHQVINNRETASEIPPPPQKAQDQQLDACLTRASRVSEMHVHAQAEGKGKEGKGTGREGSVEKELEGKGTNQKQEQKQKQNLSKKESELIPFDSLGTPLSNDPIGRRKILLAKQAKLAEEKYKNGEFSNVGKAS
jgi:hypothetical protein